MARYPAREARVHYWWHMKRVSDSQKLLVACVGACQILYGYSWLGFAQDCLFCHSMPLLWQLDEQNDEIRELQGLWV